MSWTCPNCGSCELNVTAIVSVKLMQNKQTDEFETVMTDNVHEWDDGSTMWCGRCGHADSAAQFDDDYGNLRRNPEGPMPKRRVNDGK
jgi:hypothetical protein